MLMHIVTVHIEIRGYDHSNGNGHGQKAAFLVGRSFVLAIHHLIMS